MTDKLKSMKYRKKPVVVDAYQTDKEVIIHTLEGDMKADVGDYIITGVKGEQYPCKPDIFEQTYEKVVPDNEIIKALNVCVGMQNDCGDCPLLEYSKASDECMTELMSNALDLINRLQNDVIAREQEYEDMLHQRNSVERHLEIAKAENERLEHQLETLCLALRLAKAEAYKEFAEKLCEDRVSNDPVVIAAKCLLKELVGDQNG